VAIALCVGMQDRVADRKHTEAVYEIRAQGHLDHRWSEWFDGLEVAHGQDGTTVLTGLVADQAALYGLLERMRDLGLALVSVNRVA
jgi:hypothetical protein